MKGLIKKILREQAEEDLGGVPQIEDNAMRRIRIVLNSMKSYKGWDKYMEDIYHQKKEPYGYQELRENMENILKLIGGGGPIGATDTFEKTYWFSKVFMINGGYSGNFKEGEIQVIELPVYEMEGEYTEEVFEFRTGWGNILAVNSAEEAIDLFSNDIDTYVEDSDTGDSDYGDTFDVNNVVVQNMGWIKFLPQWVGL